ncbi:unnamed protein product [Cylindrotheca closterium]|uniref:Uncharacterized protein n=1 Tax=Cylindrotheca closterium TaxID=2856 RepID=A0AAD2GAA8_9STRA|nr:unnamed protein product [Cylindrotheca closterium]
MLFTRVLSPTASIMATSRQAPFRNCYLPLRSGHVPENFAIFRPYNKAGFQVKMIKCDRAFIVLTDDMLDNMGVTIDPTAAGDHEPTTEQNNRTLKERVSVALVRLPYKVVPKVITDLDVKPPSY